MTCLLLWTVTSPAQRPWTSSCSGKASHALPASCNWSHMLCHLACLDVANMPSGTNQSCRLLRAMVTCWVQHWSPIQMMKVQAEHATSKHETEPKFKYSIALGANHASLQYAKTLCCHGCQVREV